MVLWRISKHLELNGRGGISVAGRWHHAGMPVVYLAASPAGALLEVCVHTSANDIPPSLTLLKVGGPDGDFDSITLRGLDKDWARRVEISRNLGSEWLKGGKTALLEIPSALVPETFNYLLNPLHPNAKKFQIRETFPFPFDLRLKG